VEGRNRLQIEYNMSEMGLKSGNVLTPQIG